MLKDTILTGVLKQLATGHWIVEYPQDAGIAPAVIAPGDVICVRVGDYHWQKTRIDLGIIFGKKQFYSIAGLNLQAGQQAAYLGAEGCL